MANKKPDKEQEKTLINEVIHELKSPLTSIMSYSEAFLKGGFGKSTDKQKEALTIIHRQSKRILDIINDILAIARLESGKVKITRESADLCEIIEHALEVMKPLLLEKDLKFSQEIAPPPPPLDIDRERIFEVIINLLSNAVKFSKPGGKIFLSTQLSKKEVQFSIRDEGMGIKPEDLEHIFEKFYRASTKEAAAVKGTGLGLALSKTIIEMHGGRIGATSKGPGQGSVFYFTLPL